MSLEHGSNGVRPDILLAKGHTSKLYCGVVSTLEFVSDRVFHWLVTASGMIIVRSRTA